MQYEHNGLTIKILRDEECESPRERDGNLGTIAAFHRRYDLGEKDHGYTVGDFESWGELEGLILRNHPGAVVLPLYLLDHSGLSISTRSDAFRSFDPEGWDWGQVGFVFCPGERIRKEYGVSRISAKIREKVGACLVSEVQEYGRWLSGECYGFVIEDSDGECLDSCWGMIGEEWTRQAAEEAAGGLVQQVA